MQLLLKRINYSLPKTSFVLPHTGRFLLSFISKSPFHFGTVVAFHGRTPFSDWSMVNRGTAFIKKKKLLGPLKENTKVIAHTNKKPTEGNI